MQKFYFPNISSHHFWSLNITLVPGDRVWLIGDLWAGKTTIAQFLIHQYMNDQKISVRSPTYVYYQKYGTALYHFDLYRADDYTTFESIWGEEILDNPQNICIIEWPDRIEQYWKPTKIIRIEKTDDPLLRSITLEMFP